MSDNEVCNTVHCDGSCCARWSTCAYFHSSGSAVDWSTYGSGSTSTDGLTFELPVCGENSDPPHAKYKPMHNLFSIYDSGIVAVGKIEQPLFNTIQIENCERIILKDKSLEFCCELAADKIKNYDTLIINGFKFSKIGEDNG